METKTITKICRFNIYGKCNALCGRTHVPTVPTLEISKMRQYIRRKSVCISFMLFAKCGCKNKDEDTHLRYDVVQILSGAKAARTTVTIRSDRDALVQKFMEMQTKMMTVMVKKFNNLQSYIKTNNITLLTSREPKIELKLSPDNLQFKNNDFKKMGLSSKFSNIRTADVPNTKARPVPPVVNKANVNAEDRPKRVVNKSEAFKDPTYKQSNKTMSNQPFENRPETVVNKFSIKFEDRPEMVVNKSSLLQGTKDCQNKPDNNKESYALTYQQFKDAQMTMPLNFKDKRGMSRQIYDIPQFNRRFVEERSTAEAIEVLKKHSNILSDGLLAPRLSSQLDACLTDLINKAYATNGDEKMFEDAFNRLTTTLLNGVSPMTQIHHWPRIFRIFYIEYLLFTLNQQNNSGKPDNLT